MDYLLLLQQNNFLSFFEQFTIHFSAINKMSLNGGVGGAESISDACGIIRSCFGLELVHGQPLGRDSYGSSEPSGANLSRNTPESK